MEPRHSRFAFAIDAVLIDTENIPDQFNHARRPFCYLIQPLRMHIATSSDVVLALTFSLAI